MRLRRAVLVLRRLRAGPREGTRSARRIAPDCHQPRHETIPIYGGGHHKEIARLPGCLVCGPRARFEVISTAEMKAIAGVHFRPGGAPPFLGVPASELSDLDVPLESLWGSIANDLREQLVEASGPDEVFRMLEACLLSRAAGKLCLNPIVASALEEFQKVPHTRTISELADQTGLSQRRFIEIFRDNVGLTPKPILPRVPVP